MLIGDRLVGTPYEVSFRVDHENEKLCSKELNKKDLDRFRQAVQDDYYFQVRNLLNEAWPDTPRGCSKGLSRMNAV